MARACVREREQPCVQRLEARDGRGRGEREGVSQRLCAVFFHAAHRMELRWSLHPRCSNPRSSVWPITSPLTLAEEVEEMVELEGLLLLQHLLL